MSTTDGGTTWQIDILNDYLPDLAFNSIDILDNETIWVTGLSDLLLVKYNFTNNFQEVFSQDFQISPNPVSSELNILCEREVSEMLLFDHKGKVVFTKEGSTQLNIQINMAHLPSGIYFLRIDREVRKVVKI